MAQVIPAIVKVVAQILTVQTLKRVAVAVAINALSRMLQPKSKDASADRSSRFEKRRDSSPYRDVILGTAITAGTFVDATAYGTDNMFYCEIIKLADHECDGLVAAYAGGRQLTINGDGSVQEYIESGTPRMWIYFQPGAWGETTHSEVLTAFAGRYTASDRGRGVCRVVLKCDMRSDKLFPSKSPPDITFAIRGAKIYSPRLDTSLGGSQTWGNYATYAWTNNLADIAYNVARGIFVYGGATPERLAGGAYDAEELPLASWAAEGNACEVLVPLKAGGSIKRYTGGLIFSTNEELEGILADLAAGAAGYVLDLGGTLIFQAGVARTPVATLTDADFIAGKLRRTWRQRARERFNTVTGRFTDPALRYQQNSLPIRRSTADIAQDNNEERVETMNLGVVQANAQGQRVMEIRRRQNRRNDMFQVEMPARWQHLEAGDWITYTSQRRGWTKTFVLLPAELKTSPEDMLVSAFTMVEVSANDYTWTPATDELDVTNPAGVGPGSIPDATLSGFVAIAAANSSATDLAPAIDVTWTAPSDPTVKTVAIDYKRAASATWLTQSFDASLASGQISGLSGGSWQVRARPISQPLRPGTATSVVTVVLQSVVAGEANAGPGGLPILNRDVGLGVNQVMNSDFNQDVTGFFHTNETDMGGSGFGLAFGRNLVSSPNNYFGARNVVYSTAQVTSGSLTGSFLRGWAQRGFFTGLAECQRWATRCRPGDRIYAGASVALLGLTQAQIIVRFMNAAGGYVDQFFYTQTVGDGRVNGLNGELGLPANYTRVGEFFTAPAGAVYCAMAVAGLNINGAQGSVWLFKNDYQNCVVAPGQTAIPPYSPGQADMGADRTAEAVPIVEGPASVSFDVDAAGALSPGSQVPRTLQFIRKQGTTDVSASTTWQIISPVNVTLGAITNGGVNITAVAPGNSAFTVRSIRDGVTIDHLVTVQKNTVGGTSSRINRSVVATVTTSATYVSVLSVPLANAPTGIAKVDLTYDPFTPSGGSTLFQLRLTRAGVQVAETPAFEGIDAAGTLTFEWASAAASLSGFYSAASGTATWALEARRVSGSGSFAGATGEIVVNQQPT